MAAAQVERAALCLRRFSGAHEPGVRCVRRCSGGIRSLRAARERLHSRSAVYFHPYSNARISCWLVPPDARWDTPRSHTRRPA